MCGADPLLAIFICFLENAGCVIRGGSCQLCSYPACHLSPRVQPCPAQSQSLWVRSEPKKRQRGFYGPCDKQVTPFLERREAGQAAATSTRVVTFCLMSPSKAAGATADGTSSSQHSWGPTWAHPPRPPGGGAQRVHVRSLISATTRVNSGTRKWTQGPASRGKWVYLLFSQSKV